MSSFTLKILAIIFMTIDHIGFILFPKIDILRVIGRIAFPIFAFQVGISFENTKNKEKYILRMLIFTIISQIPFHIFLQTVSPGYPHLVNTGATLTCGILALYCLEKFENKILKYASTLLVILLGVFIPIDYGWLGILMIIVLSYFKKDKLFASVSFATLVSINCIVKNSSFNLPEIIALIPILLYNGKKGPNVKYLFYIFYPLHLIILVIIKSILQIN